MLGQVDTVAFSVLSNTKTISAVAAKAVLLRNQGAPQLTWLYPTHSDADRLFLWLGHETQVVL